jgi:uncharacterized protein (TIGR03083 family)
VSYVNSAEAERLLATELNRLVSLLGSLKAADWSMPTACTDWNVQAVVAHQAGSLASGSGYREMIRQYARRPARGQLPEDAANALQVAERANRSPAELIAEIQSAGPRAIRNWAHGFNLIKPISFHIPSAVGCRSATSCG